MTLMLLHADALPNRKKLTSEVFLFCFEVRLMATQMSLADAPVIL